MPPFDDHANFAVSAVATAPSPADSGTSLTVTAGHGTRFPAVPFNVSIWPRGGIPTPDNAEIARVTALAGDVLTLTRAEEGTTARAVVVGDAIAATITDKTLTDLETQATGWLNTEAFPGADLGERFNAAVATLPATGGVIVIPPGDYTTATELSFAATTVVTGAFQPVAVYAYGVTIRTTGAISGLRICGGHKAIYGLEIIQENNPDALYGINIDGSNRNANLRDVVIRANSVCPADYAAIHIGFRTDVIPHVPSYATIIQDCFIRNDGATASRMPHAILVEGASNVVTVRGGFFSADIGIRFRPIAGGIDAQELGSPGSILINGVDFEDVGTAIRFDDIATHTLPGGTRIINCAGDSVTTFLDLDAAITGATQRIYLAGNRLQPSVTTYFTKAATFADYASFDGTQLHTSFAHRTGADLEIGIGGNTFLTRDANHVLAQRNLANPQTYRLYNTTDGLTSPGTNREYLELVWTGNVPYLRTWASGTGTLRELRVVHGGTTNSALRILPTLDEGVQLAALTASATNLASGRVAVGRSSVTSATSGGSATLRLVEQFSPTATSTMTARPLHIQSIINYSHATPGAGLYEAIRIQMTETALPTGQNYMIRAAGGATGTTEVFSVTNGGTVASGRATITYSASMTPVASQGGLQTITITNGTAFTINAPTGPLTGQQITFMLRNTSGGAAGVATWNAVFKMAAWVQPATANSRSITFGYDGTNWVEIARTPADVPN